MDKTKELRTLNTKTKMREVTTYLFSYGFPYYFPLCKLFN